MKNKIKMRPPLELKPLFLERMKKIFNNEKDLEEYLRVLGVEPVRSIRCNTLKISPEDLKKGLKKKDGKFLNLSMKIQK